MLKPKGSVATVLDIGSSRIVCVVAKIKSDGCIDILGVGHKQSEGIRSGHITNAKQLVRCMLGAIDEAEKSSGEDITSVYVVVSGSSLRSHYCSVDTIVNGHEINDKDTKILFNKCSELFNDDNNFVVMHALPLQYKLDDNDGIVDPRGMYGSVLSANFHIVTASRSALLNLAHCVSRCHVTIAGYIPSSYASGVACLSADERKLGVAVVDLGGGCATIGVFDNDNLAFNASIAIGGFHITKDIASGLSTTIAHAEKIKVLRGVLLVTAMDRNEPIEVPCIVSSSGDYSDDEVSHITKETLADIIRPRVEEILDFVMEKLKIADQRFPCMHRVVFTGGASKLSGMKELIRHMYPDMRARIGHANLEYTTDAIDMSDPTFSSAIGSMMLIKDTFFNETRQDEESPFFIKRFVNWVKEKVDI